MKIYIKPDRLLNLKLNYKNDLNLKLYLRKHSRDELLRLSDDLHGNNGLTFDFSIIKPIAHTWGVTPTRFIVILCTELYIKKNYPNNEN